MANKNQKSDIKSWIFGIIAAILAILQIARIVSSNDDYSIDVRGDYNLLNLPMGMIVECSYGVDCLTLSDDKSLSFRIPDPDYLKDNDEVKYMGFSIDNFFKTYWEFEIVNVGNKKIDELNLHAPFSGYYQILSNAKTYSITQQLAVNNDDPMLYGFNETINFRDLMPSESIRIGVWSSDFSSSSLISTLQIRKNNGDFRVSYGDGSEVVKFPVKVDGFIAFLKYNQPLIFAYVASFFMLISLASQLFSSYKKSHKKK